MITKILLSLTLIIFSACSLSACTITTTKTNNINNNPTPSTLTDDQLLQQLESETIPDLDTEYTRLETELQ